MLIELTDTSAQEISSALTKAHRGAGASGLVLTLIIASDSAHFEQAVQAAKASAYAHPSRVIVVTNGDPRGSARLDATIEVGDGLPGDLLTLTVSGDLTNHSRAILLPLLLPDSPTVVWWPHEGPTDISSDPVGTLATRRITDASTCSEPQRALLTRARHHTPGDTDLTWTRLTRWRALLVSAVDQVASPVLGARVTSVADNAPATLLATWLSMKLGVPVERVDGEGVGVIQVEVETEAGVIRIHRPGDTIAEYTVPGQPPRKVALRRRPLTDLLTEELQRMDPDAVFEATVAHLLTSQGEH
ncbi:glucose-6-phosphate dehydrogenase assembly protein OpcA [Tessaracoccus sp. OH4464_COT-324]|uniref:glucose-6-phosphate dehydrogenase assembly protein OpcA n=1 Tax=Tessaracoccus sp. OH4464_COT-324 TaxID=2491059 RepID=UPI000F63A11C|nr:glucose-6-phosphate dehydrogenase assembly protein OpcA [Tessaracoccus sp. OH4464_COT-324]RRD47708.1 OpcA protein [Tessaracoccus sp. OH4464_COT-324]